MNKLATPLLALLLAVPVFADDDRHQSYITYDDGDTILLQEDGREIDARINLPVYPGDELRTGLRGRSEVRLSDGNVFAVDRDSRVLFESMLATYEGDDTQTVARLLRGEVLVYRLYRGSEPMRLDTSNASYLSSRESLYGVETNTRGIDVVTVFEGQIEVRTRAGVNKLRAGDRAKVDVTGVYSRVELARNGATEFQQWFIRRADRYSEKESRYLDSSLSYIEDDLDDHGRWVYVNDYNTHVWRPYVSASWRPYSHGYWYPGSRGGLTWVSYEPWGWGPYHYGRWSHHSYWGWVWLPGGGYSPAWVYWAYGPSWVGWAPAGWYDCFYYNWLYRPYYNTTFYGRYGFRGSIRVSSRDLRAYTVVDRNVLFSNRIDRASLTADQIRNRLARDGNSAVLSNRPFRVKGDEIRDPSRAVDRIIRGSDGSGTGNSQGAGSSGDVTKFFQRDPALSASVRDRVTRGMPSGDRTGSATTRSGTTPSVSGRNGDSPRPGTVTRGTRTTPRAGSGSTSGTVPRGSTGATVPRATPRAGSGSGGTSSSGAVPRGTVKPRTQDTNTENPRNEDQTNVRPRTINRPSGEGTRTGQSTGTRTTRPARPTTESREPAVTKRPSTRSTDSSSDGWRNGSSDSKDPAQRVITTIGGARISPSRSQGTKGSSAKPSSTTRSGSTGTRTTVTRTPRSSGSDRGTSTRSSGNSSSTRSSSSGRAGVTRPSKSGSSSGSKSSSTRATPRRSSGSKSSSTRSTPSRSSGSKSSSTKSSGSRSSSSGRAGVSRPSTKSASGSKSSTKSSSSKSSSSSSGKTKRSKD